jgi:lysophospholipase L1-like esterase
MDSPFNVTLSVMNKLILIPFCFWIFISCNKPNWGASNTIPTTRVTSFKDSVHYLALGDSYTIGASVERDDNFPNQTFQLLKSAGFKTSSIQIIAKNGWTAEDLITAVATTNKRSNYQVVTLLIGVNNQYQGNPSKEFEPSFLTLLKSAITLTGNRPKRVFVMSIPDWGITPFASGRDRKQIANEIDAYNLVCEKNTKAEGANFINITDAYRIDGSKPDYLSGDGLHPSKLEYTKWAIKLTQQIVNVLEAGG